MSEQQPNVTPQQIFENLWAARAALALAAGVELGVFSHVEAGKTTVKDVARAAKSSARGMRHLMDALTGMGYLNKKGDKYTNTPVASQFLVKDKPAYLGVMVAETRMTLPGWARLPEVVQTGRPVEAVDTEEAGREFFPKLVQAIFPMSYGAAQATIKALPQKSLKRIKTILDVAAGSAAWSLPFAQTIPDAKVTVVDYPEVTPVARQYAERFGVADRYEYSEGNLRNIDFGRDRYDLVILGHIIHSEGEKWGKKLVKKAARALHEGGTLMIAEMIPNDTRSGPIQPLIFGLNMLIHTEAGDVFTMREYREWLKEAGFRKVQTIDVGGPAPLILATK